MMMAAVGGFFYFVECKCLARISAMLDTQIALRITEKMKAFCKFCRKQGR
jgi:hypothetical protein